jgi:predicted metal-dependent HD superfamily phosphohydrolase
MRGFDAVDRNRSERMTTATTSDERVETAWDQLTAKVASTSDPARRRTMRQQLLAAYREPHRAYHTLDHIAALLALFDVHGGSARDPDAVLLAILYHDVVYDPRRSDNEAVSAQIAARDLTELGVAPRLVARVADLVLATQHGVHSPDAADTDLALLLDLDLSVLAASMGDYDAYAAAIRHEYAHVPSLLYRPGRRRVLEKFLAADQLYLTADLKAQWEQPARANLAREINSLSFL